MSLHHLHRELIFTIDYNHFETLLNEEIIKIFPDANIHGYNFVAAHECSNDSTHRIVVTEQFEKDMAYYAAVDFIKSENKRYNWQSTEYILLLLVHHNVIEPGVYMIDVSW